MMRIKFYVATTIFLILFLPSAYAYDFHRCLKGVFTGPTEFFSPDIYTSTTQFMSSWGPCAAIGKREIERLNFVVVNRTALEKDAARGMGENLDTLASLFDIPTQQRLDFGKYVQRNYAAIFGDSVNKNATQVFNDLEGKIAQFKPTVTRLSTDSSPTMLD